MARRTACLAILDRQLQQLEMDRALMKRELMDKVDQEFDKLRTLTLKIKAEIVKTGGATNSSPSQNIGGPNSMPCNDSNTAQVGSNLVVDNSSPQSTSASTSYAGRGRKRKQISRNHSSGPTQKRSRKSSFSCIYPDCGKAFPRDAHLVNHERTHTGVRPFTCTWPDCHYDAAGQSHVVKHIRSVHFKLPIYKKVQRALDITDRRDPNRWIRVNQHLANKRLTKSNIGSFIKSNSKVDMRRIGKKNVNKVLNFVCRSPGCGESFRTSANRIIHERAIHLKAKPYGCTWPDCGFVASQRCVVVRHVRGVNFGLPQSKKLQAQMSITDDRDPNQWVSLNKDEASRRVEEQ